MNANNKPTHTHWTDHWFDEDYILLYKHRNESDAKEQINLLLKVLAPKKSKLILDVGCGYGRHVRLLHEKGYAIEGLDKSAALIKYGKKKWPNLPIAHGDVRSFAKEKPQHYDILLSLFTSFGYYNLRDNHTILKSIHSCLKKNGLFWLDFLNAESVRQRPLTDTFTQISENKVIVQKRRIQKNRILKHILVMQRNKKDKEFLESVCLYSKADLVGLLNDVGFKVLKVFGDYKGSKWSQSSPRTLLLSRKMLPD